MNPDPDRLYTLLPGVYRRRDYEQGEPLRALLAIVAEQVNIVQADIEQLYDDWFIETCQDWVVPYLGDLVGYQLLHGFEEALATGTDEAKELLATIAPRRDVAHTVANRRRKGTLALLEQLAADVAGWPARAVEFRRLLSITQPVRLYGSDQQADAARRRRGRLSRPAARRRARPARRAIRRSRPHGRCAAHQLGPPARALQHRRHRAIRLAAAPLFGHRGPRLLR